MIAGKGHQEPLPGKAVLDALFYFTGDTSLVRFASIRGRYSAQGNRIESIELRGAGSAMKIRRAAGFLSRSGSLFNAHKTPPMSETPEQGRFLAGPAQKEVVVIEKR